MKQGCAGKEVCWTAPVSCCWVGSCVHAMQVVMPGHFDRGFLHGSGQISPTLKPSPFSVVTVPCSSGTTRRTLGISSEELQELQSCPECNTEQDTSEMCSDEKELYFCYICAVKFQTGHPNQTDSLQLFSSEGSADSPEEQYMEDSVFVLCKYFERA